LKDESARPFFQVGHFFLHAARDKRDRVYISIYIFSSLISQCPLQPLFQLQKSSVGLTSADVRKREQSNKKDRASGERTKLESNPT